MCVSLNPMAIFCYLSPPLNNRIEDWIKHLCFHMFDLMSESRSVEQFTARINHHCGLAATLTSFFFYFFLNFCHFLPFQSHWGECPLGQHLVPLCSAKFNRYKSISRMFRAATIYLKPLINAAKRKTHRKFYIISYHI